MRQVAAEQGRRRSETDVLVAYGVGRLLTVLGFWIGHLWRPGDGWLSAFSNWDGAYYLTIVDRGYPQSVPDLVDGPVPFTAAFFPLYPGIIRVLNRLTGLPEALLGVTLSVLGGAAAAVLFVRLARRYFEETTARRAGVLFALFPGGVVFGMVYAEGLMLALTALCLLALERERWLAGGVLGALATATRPIAIALIPAAAFTAWCRRGTRAVWAPLGALLLVPVGMISYLGALWALTGSPTGWFVTQQRGWSQSLDFGTGFGFIVLHPSNLTDPLWVIYLAGFAVIAWLAFQFVRGARLPGMLGWYSAAVMAQLLLNSGVGPRPRFLLTAFPLLLLPASRQSKRAHQVTVGVFAAGLVVLATVYSAPEFVSP